MTDETKKDKQDPEGLEYQRARFIAFVGATRYEMQVGRFWITILRPKYICRNNLPRLVLMGWDRDGE